MNLKLSKEEYITLVDAFCIAEWILHAHHSSKEKPPETKAFRKLEQKIYKLGGKFGSDDLFDKIKEDNGTKYYPNKKVEGKNLIFIDEFKENSFWDELINIGNLKPFLKKNMKRNLPLGL